MMKQNSPKIVTHFVAGYPTLEASLDVARGLISGGAYALEMQIPFSDPTADGPIIEAACRESLSAGFKVSDAWRIIETIRRESEIPFFVMSYASLAYTPGIEKFVKTAASAGATGLIIPDLAPGADEGLYATARASQCPAVPVVVPWIEDRRLDEILSEDIDWVYVALRSGITGTYTELGESQETFLKKLKDRGTVGGPRVMAGFGIQQASQVKTVTQLADAAIVGSAIVSAISQSDLGGVGTVSRELVESLRGMRA